MHKVEILCKMLGVSRSGYYAWVSRPKSNRSMENEKLLEHIQKSHTNSRRTYGYRRVHQDLVAEQISVAKNRVYRLMKKHGIQAKTRKKFKVTTDSKHSNPIYKNILNREFNVNKPNLRWVSDITYIPTQEGWLYLAVIMDLFSRKIVGWAMDSRMKEDLVISALKMALFKRKTNSSLLLHSDRGSQYAASNYQSVLTEYGIQCSMSRKGNCWDNSAMESFFHSLKVEHVHHEQYKTRV